MRLRKSWKEPWLSNLIAPRGEPFTAPWRPSLHVRHLPQPILSAIPAGHAWACQVRRQRPINARDRVQLPPGPPFGRPASASNSARAHVDVSASRACASLSRAARSAGVRSDAQFGVPLLAGLHGRPATSAFLRLFHEISIATQNPLTTDLPTCDLSVATLIRLAGSGSRRKRKLPALLQAGSGADTPGG